MKILMIGVKRYPNSREGGVDIVVARLAEEMVKMGHDVTILTRRKKGYNPPNFYNGVKIKKIFTINKKATDALVYSYLATKYAKKSNVDVVHFHAEGNTLFLKKLRKSKKNIVVTIHGLDWKRDKFSGFGNKILKKSEKQIAKYADFITTLTPNDSEYFFNEYKRETTIIPNGIDIPTQTRANIIKEKYGLEKNKYILFLARIVPEKGLHYLIEAYNGINNPKCKLVISGGNSHSQEYFKEMKDLAKNNPNILFTGFVSGDELNELFSNAKLYVLPSDIEGMPLSLIEALSYRKVCLCSNIKELKCIDSKNIHYFEQGNVDDLRNKLVDLIESKSSFENENVFLTWDSIAAEYIKVYEREKKDESVVHKN